MMRPGREAHGPNFEDRLHEWVLDKRLKGIGISGSMIRLKVRLSKVTYTPIKIEIKIFFTKYRVRCDLYSSKYSINHLY